LWYNIKEFKTLQRKVKRGIKIKTASVNITVLRNVLKAILYYTARLPMEKVKCNTSFRGPILVGDAIGRGNNDKIFVCRKHLGYRLPLPSEAAIEEIMQFERNYVPDGSKSEKCVQG
jgi:hypothetical protein